MRSLFFSLACLSIALASQLFSEEQESDLLSTMEKPMSLSLLSPLEMSDANRDKLLKDPFLQEQEKAYAKELLWQHKLSFSLSLFSFAAALSLMAAAPSLVKLPARWKRSLMTPYKQAARQLRA